MDSRKRGRNRGRGPSTTQHHKGRVARPTPQRAPPSAAPLQTDPRPLHTHGALLQLQSVRAGSAGDAEETHGRGI